MRSTKANNLQVGDVVLTSKGDKERGTVATLEIEPVRALKVVDGVRVAEEIPGKFHVRAWDQAGLIVVDARHTTRVKIAS